MSHADNPPIEIDCADVLRQLEQKHDFLLLDCREQDEYDLVRIDGALLLPMSELVERAADLEPYRRRSVVVYCHHGGRSLRVAAWLRQQGFSAQSMAGGIDRWAREIDTRLPTY